MTVLFAAAAGMLGFLAWGLLLAVAIERGHPDYDGTPTMTFSPRGLLFIVVVAVLSAAVLMFGIATSESALTAGMGVGAAVSSLVAAVCIRRTPSDVA